MSMVAKNSSVAAGTIYHYFESKDELIMELYHYLVAKVVDAAQSGDDDQLPFKERFMRFWHNMKKLYVQDRSIHRFMEQFYNSPYFTEEMEMTDNQWHNWMRNFFTDGINSGELRSGVKPEILSIMVHGTILSSVKVTIYHGKKMDMDQINLGHIAEIVWDGIKKQPEAKS
ncbi:TetR family transcriptional regulator [Echinicola pacifica]|uniref:TetR family transcriptional regulator n=2 Tax=Echinicola pacifica TaxID=346377 RepID=A0A918Q4B5_9BACT|nr:TetR family transcriptional regulator [Echinicola pacifica]